MSRETQSSLTFQYLYFLRFSLLLWLFPLFFAFADSGRFPIATQALTRGIFVPEYAAGYICVAFFLVCKGSAALVAARTVVISGKERFNADPPDWLKRLLMDDTAEHETRPVVWSQVPNLLTLSYICLNGIGEGVPWNRVILGSLAGVLIGGVFCYLLNAWYYLAYQPDVPPRGGDVVLLGHNAARTILFPRSAFRLKRPDEIILAGPERETLEDIRTGLRENWFATKGGRLIALVGDEMWRRAQHGPEQRREPQPWSRVLRHPLRSLRGWVVRSVSFTGYVRVRLIPGTRRHVSSIYETHIFTFVATAAFGGLFWALYPLTAPEPSHGTQAAFLVVLAALLYAVQTFRSGRCENATLRRKWKLILIAGVSLFCVTIPYLYATTSADRFPTLASVLLLIIVLGWVMTLISFYFDRFRLPVLTTYLALAGLPHIAHWYGSLEEHYISTVTPKKEQRAMLRPPTPAEILSVRLAADSDSPVVIVTATGGGLHASAWMTHVLKNLDESFPVGERERFRKQILLMSTVSGGSVGLSYYLRELDKQVTPGGPRFGRMIYAAQCSSLEAVGWGLAYYDLQKALGFGTSWFWHASNGLDDLNGSPLGKDRTWALRKAFERNSSDPYCLKEASETEQVNGQTALITAKPNPFRRLYSAERSEVSRQTLATLKASKDFPAFTMNTTTAEGGDRFLLANYRLPGYAIGPMEGHPAESFLDLLPPDQQLDLPLATAAQMSATFPYVSSAARIPGAAASDHFIDGGYYDNDGTASAIEFLRFALSKPLSGKEADPRDQAFQAEAASRLKNKKLKVLLVEIRNSEDTIRVASVPAALNPGKDAKPGGAFEQIFFPLLGFWSAGHESVTGRNRNGLDLLVKDDGLPLQVHQVIFDDVAVEKQGRHYGIEPAKDPLSWSLTPRERMEVKTSSDRRKRLGDCYDDVVAWTKSERWTGNDGWTVDAPAKRCTDDKK